MIKLYILSSCELATLFFLQYIRGTVSEQSEREVIVWVKVKPRNGTREYDEWNECSKEEQVRDREKV